MPEDTALLAIIAQHTPKPRSKGVESSLVAALLKLANLKPHVTLWRNNTGVLRDVRGNYIAYGLCVGSSDLIGYRSRIITQADVGTRIAQFVAVEAKAPRGQLRERQAQFLAQCREAGAIAVCVKSVDELEQALR